MNNVIDISKRYQYEIIDRYNRKIYKTQSINIKYAYIRLCRELKLDKSLFEYATEFFANEFIQYYRYKHSKDLLIAFSIRRVL